MVLTSCLCTYQGVSYLLRNVRVDTLKKGKRYLFNIYSMKQPDLYHFETIKMTSQAWSNFVWRIGAAGENSL